MSEFAAGRQQGGAISLSMEDKGGQPSGTLVVQVASALRSAILAGQYSPGDKLPSEARLTEMHGVSRTVVRE